MNDFPEKILSEGIDSLLKTPQYLLQLPETNEKFLVFQEDNVSPHYLSIIEHNKNLAETFLGFCEFLFGKNMLDKLLFPPNFKKYATRLIYAHDIGKLIYKKILMNKPVLEPDDMLKIKRHPYEGVRLLGSGSLDYMDPCHLFAVIQLLPDKLHRFALNIMLCHSLNYSKPEGGYPPLGDVYGDKIPIEAQIMAIIDSFDQFTYPSKFRNPPYLVYTLKDALAELQSAQSQNGSFSPLFLNAFIDFSQNTQLI